MTLNHFAQLDRTIANLPNRYPGPGGAVAVVKDGVAIVRHAWGFADLEKRMPYSASTLAPICSISKQFTCATLLDVTPDPAVLDSAVAAQMPRLEGEKPSTLDLANNQSGLRDYWALTVLCGAMPEGDFRPTDSAALIALTRTLHFRPGTAYSYSNGNFRILANAIQQKSGRDFGELLVERIAKPAGLETAVFVTEASMVPGGAVGHEGTLTTGWRRGINRIHWCGDAGICASIDDLIAWEQFIDKTRDEVDSLYARLTAPLTFKDGSPAGYGLGVVQKTRWGRKITGHGGAIRGWRLHRLHVPSERLSVDIAFNHESGSEDAAMHVLAAALGESDIPEPSNAGLAAAYSGTWLDTDIGLLLEVAINMDGTLAATYDGGAETLSVGQDGVARGLGMSLTHDGSALRIIRPADAVNSRAIFVSGTASTDIAGTYRSMELESDLEIVNAGGSWFAGFKGILGSGPLMQLLAAGPDLWRLACHRSLDSAAPGNWTIQIKRSTEGAPRGLTIGCWLARSVDFTRS